MQAIKLLLGGSPCTHWSIAQTKNRETQPSGIGWELFQNYRIARDTYKPDYFLYENNKSMSPAIRAQITRELGVDPVLINSALVSGQSRKRLYWVGRRNGGGTYSKVDVGQPEDRGILLQDVLERGLAIRNKGYALLTNAGKTTAEDAFGHRQRNVVADPIRIGTIASATKNANADSQQYRVYAPNGKAVTLCGNGGGIGAKTSLYAVPVGMAWRGRPDGSKFEMRGDEKANTLTADGHQSRLVIEEAAIFQNSHGFNKGGIKHKKAPTLTANGNWTSNNFCIEAADGKTTPIYEVRGGLITIKGKQYTIPLADGDYIIRKLTVTECKRLQTVPEDYIFPVSDTQAYKMLGNGWTVDVIAHIMSHFAGLTDCPVEVLSMYDALDKLGVNVAAYYATEIDEYAIKTTQANFPDTVQLGDAFQVRDVGWVNKIKNRKEG